MSKNGALSVAELVRALNVSRETIRRDLNALAERGLIVTTHGGALVERPARAATSKSREAANAAAKRAIGERAAQLVPDGASLIIDSGSTTQAVARALLRPASADGLYERLAHRAAARPPQRQSRDAARRRAVRSSKTPSFGLDTVQQLSQYHADFAFVGAGGITAGRAI